MIDYCNPLIDYKKIIDEYAKENNDLRECSKYIIEVMFELLTTS